MEDNLQHPLYIYVHNINIVHLLFDNKSHFP